MHDTMLHRFLGGSPLEALPELDITADVVDVRWPDGSVDRVAMPPG